MSSGDAAPGRTAPAPDDHVRRAAVVVGVGVGLLVGVVAVLVTAGVGWWTDTPLSQLTREPQSTLGVGWYVGMLSNAGGVLWTVAATVAGLGAAVVPAGPQRRILVAVAVLSTALLADDLFLLHDQVYPQVGLDGTAVAGLYGLAMGGVLLASRRALGLPTAFGVMVVLGLLGLSAGLDALLNDSALNGDQLTEDGIKFAGIAVWAGVWTAVVVGQLRPPATALAGPGARPDVGADARADAAARAVDADQTPSRAG